MSSKINSANVVQYIRGAELDIGKHCNKAYECDTKVYCWKVQRQISEYSIFNIFNPGSKKQIELYSGGIVNIDDIPHDFDMTSNQARLVENYKSKLIYKTFYNILP